MLLDLDFHSFHVLPRSKRVSAHFPLYATRVDTRPARHNAFLKNLSQNRFMISNPVLRGVLPRSSRFFVGPRELREGMIACPDPRLLSKQPHASVSYTHLTLPTK